MEGFRLQQLARKPSMQLGYRELVGDDVPAGFRAARVRWPDAACFIGGHSLGGQVVSMYAGLHPQVLHGLVLVAGGKPYWHQYRYGRLVYLSYVASPLLARVLGYLPGRRIGFGGNEAWGLMADWAASGRTGIDSWRGMAQNIETPMRALQLPVLVVRLSDHWLAPAASLAWLLSKMPQASETLQVLDENDMGGVTADHFAWMQSTAPVVRHLVAWFDHHTTRPA